MFLKTNRFRSGYTSQGEQRAKDLFLAVFSGEENYPDPHPQTGRQLPVLYAVVRTVELRSWGHWMMGSLRLAGAPVTVSGAYGGDGLPMDLSKLSEAQKALLTPVPFDLAITFWSGGGHNCAGEEAEAMRGWARANLKQLTRTRP